MANRILFLSTIVFIVASRSYGFIPSVPAMLKEVLEGRKPVAGTEIVMRHQIEIRQGELLEFEERLMSDSSKSYFSWRNNGMEQPFWAVLERKNYNTGLAKFPSSSALFLKKFLATNVEDFASLLLSEQFIRRDQLVQFKPTFEALGDPQTWEIKENYIQHEGIFLKRIRGGAGYAVMGFDEKPNSHIVVFDKGLSGIRRLEWKEGETISAWNFEQFTRFASGGLYPKRISFEKNGVEVIISELITHRPVKEKQVIEFRNSLQRTANRPLSAANEEALKLLLSYR